jgi:density-regulated protein
MAEVDSNGGGSNLLPRRTVIYCGKCGMPPEYCEYGPDFETHCDPWLRKHHPDLRQELIEKRGSASVVQTKKDAPAKPPKPDKPRTVDERLMAFYQKYVPEKAETGTVTSLLEKYAGKEEKLFQALTQKYGPEPLDPYYSDSDDDNDDDSEADSDAETEIVKTTGKRRGAAAKASVDGTFTGRVVVQKHTQKKKRVLTVVTGLEPALALNHHKLKDATKAFAKRFAGSSSVKDDSVILQGDHVLELAEMLVDKFQVPEEAVFVDMGDGNEVPLRG